MPRDILGADVSSGSGGGAQIQFRAQQDTPGIAIGTWTRLSWPTPTSEEGGWVVDNVTDKSLLVPETGLYAVTINVGFVAVTTGTIIHFMLNKETVAGNHVAYAGGNSDGASPPNKVLTTIVRLTAAEKLYIWAHQNSGSSQTGRVYYGGIVRIQE